MELVELCDFSELEEHIRGSGVTKNSMKYKKEDILELVGVEAYRQALDCHYELSKHDDWLALISCSSAQVRQWLRETGASPLQLMVADAIKVGPEGEVIFRRRVVVLAHVMKRGVYYQALVRTFSARENGSTPRWENCLVLHALDLYFRRKLVISGGASAVISTSYSTSLDITYRDNLLPVIRLPKEIGKSRCGGECVRARRSVNGLLDGPLSYQLISSGSMQHYGYEANLRDNNFFGDKGVTEADEMELEEGYLKQRLLEIEATKSCERKKEEEGRHLEEDIAVQKKRSKRREDNKKRITEGLEEVPFIEPERSKRDTVEERVTSGISLLIYEIKDERAEGKLPGELDLKGRTVDDKRITDCQYLDEELGDRHRIEDNWRQGNGDFRDNERLWVGVAMFQFREDRKAFQGERLVRFGDPDCTTSWATKFLDDYRESAGGEKEPPFHLRLGRELNLVPAERVTIGQFVCYRYLGAEWVTTVDFNRLFFGQLKHLLKLRALVVEHSHDPKIPITETFEDELSLAKNHHSVTDPSWTPDPDFVKQHQAHNGGNTHCLKSGRHLNFAVRKLASSPALPTTIKAYRRLTTHSCRNPWFVAMVPQRFYDSSAAVDPVTRFSEVEVSWFSDSDYATEADGESISGGVCQIEGMQVAESI